MSQAVTIEPARSGEIAEAFALIFRQPAEATAGRVANALRLVRSGELDPAGILVARGNRHLWGALVCLPVPGASGLIWPPQVCADPPTAIEDDLVRRAAAWLRQRGAKLGQALLAPAE